eukprot:scpid79279/ scgid2436/ Ephrin type-A receptor 3; EPH-like kinase 4; Tyrosine-protein kinase TYRO4; Tyrosine-protein kinase receptor ETK1
MWQGMWCHDESAVLRAYPRSLINMPPLAATARTIEQVCIKAFHSPAEGGETHLALGHFLLEARQLACFDDDNIIKLIGIVRDNHQPWMILELMSRGSLLNYLRSIAVEKHKDHGLPRQLLSFSQEIACGLAYLHQQSFLHRDLSGKHLMLTEDFRCKICDVAMSPVLADESFFTSRDGKLEVKWCAPEVLSHRDFSCASDVWSFSVVLYEVWSLGRRPYPSWPALKVVKEIWEGFRMSPPPGVIEPLYQLMIECWNPAPRRRPTTIAVVARLQQLVDDLSKYSQKHLAVHLGKSPVVSDDFYPESAAYLLWQEMINTVLSVAEELGVSLIDIA